VSIFIGDAYVGMPLDFLVRVDVFLSAKRFSCDEVIEDCRDLEWQMEIKVSEIIFK